MKGSKDGFDATLSAQSSERWGTLLSEVIDVLSAHNRRTGMDESAALKHALTAALELARHFGGRPFYLPVGKHIKDALRNEEICRLNNGRNGRELAERFGLTLRSIQIIIAAQRDINRKKRQGLANG